MYYKINVAKNNMHFFATAERSIETLAKLKSVYNALSKAFPEPEYNITVFKYETIGNLVNMPSGENIKTKY